MPSPKATEPSSSRGVRSLGRSRDRWKRRSAPTAPYAAMKAARSGSRRAQGIAATSITHAVWSSKRRNQPGSGITLSLRCAMDGNRIATNSLQAGEVLRLLQAGTPVPEQGGCWSGCHRLGLLAACVSTDAQFIGRAGARYSRSDLVGLRARGAFVAARGDAGAERRGSTAPSAHPRAGQKIARGIRALKTPPIRSNRGTAAGSGPGGPP